MPATIAMTAFELLPPPSVIALLARHASRLQVLTSVAIEAIQRDKCSTFAITHYSALFERSDELKLEFLKLANIPLFSPWVPIVSLQQAVVRLGPRECHNLILAASISTVIRRLSLKQDVVRTILWKHLINTALLATHMSRTFRLGFEGEEFAAGLMHDFGRILLALVDSEQFVDIDPLNFNETPDQLVRESIVTGTDHCRLGAWYANQQQLPSQISEVMLWHHHPDSAGENQRLTALIAVADHMANHLHRFGESTGYYPSRNPFLSVLAQFGDDQLEAQFVRMAPALMDQVLFEAKTLESLEQCT